VIWLIVGIVVLFAIGLFALWLLAKEMQD